MTAASESPATESSTASPRVIGRPEPRVDGRLKVTGEAMYAGDVAVANPAYARMVTSPIAIGRILRIDSSASRALPGVLAIYTHENMRGRFAMAPAEFRPSSVPVMQDERIYHAGQIVAMVVADTDETAREAAQRIRIDYEQDAAPAAVFDSPRAETRAYGELEKGSSEVTSGDVASALAAADFVHDAVYETSPHHHNAMELYSTTCVWNGKHLTIYEPSQWIYSLANGIAQQFGMDRGNVTVVSTFVGGGFGAKGGVSARTPLVALAAKDLRRPVKIVLSRKEGYTATGYRAETRHQVKLGADRSGKLIAYRHETWEATSRTDVVSMGGTHNSVRIYGWKNAETLRHVVRLDRNTPGAMRAPPEVPVMFALESALDELAYKANIDPVQLRRINDTRVDPVTGRPFTSRSLIECYEAAAEAFGWKRRDPTPRSMREGDWLIGWGCATSIYPTYAAPASARVRLSSTGEVLVQVASHDMGTGAYTVISQIAAGRLGVELSKVTVELGDSRFPPAPYSGGSMTTAVIGSAVAKACDAIRVKLGVSGELAPALERMTSGAIEEFVDWVPAGMNEAATKESYTGRVRGTGGVTDKNMMFAFGAQFVEVRVNVRTHEIRVPRAVGAFAAGRIVNPRTARSQLMGGMIWGISSALHERTEVDVNTARYVNADISEYLVPVNADIGTVDIIFVPETDTQVNPLGVKGIGELGNVGTDAAVANAVFHATGVRVRKLPIRVESLLGADRNHTLKT